MMARLARAYVILLFVLELLLIAASLLMNLSVWIGGQRPAAQYGPLLLMGALLAAFPVAFLAKERNIWKNEFKSCPIWVRSVAIPIVHGPPSEDEQQRSQTKQAKDTYKSRQLSLTESNVRFTRMIAIFTVVSALAAIYQGHVGKENAEAAARAAYEACMASQISREALIDTHAAAIASTYQAIAAMRSETALFEVSNGPAVVVPGEDLRIPIDVMNYGKTSAFGLLMKVRAEFMNREDDPAFTYPKKLTSTVVGSRIRAGGPVLQRSATSGAAANVRGPDGKFIKATEGDALNFSQGKKDVIFYGIITFTDIFQIPHWYQFCFADQRFVSGQEIHSGHRKCVDYNKSDSNSAIEKPPSSSSSLPSSSPSPITCTPPQ